MQSITAIIINYNTKETTLRAVERLFAAEPKLDIKVILIDNASRELISWPSEDTRVKVIHNKENKGFAAAVNQGIQLSNSEYVLLLNSDMFIDDGCISGLLENFETDKNLGISGPCFVYPDKSFQPSAGYEPTFVKEFFRFSTLGKYFPFGTLIYRTIFNRNFFKKPQRVDWLSGGCMLIKKELIEKIGLLDEVFFFGVEDIDYCARARQAGYKVVYNPLVSTVHYHGFSSGGHRSSKKMIMEKNNMSHWFKKHLPSKKGLSAFVSLLYSLKISAFKLLGK